MTWTSVRARVTSCSGTKTQSLWPRQLNLCMPDLPSCSFVDFLKICWSIPLLKPWRRSSTHHRGTGTKGYTILMISMWPKNSSHSKSNTEVHKNMTLNGRSAKYKSSFWLFEARSWIFSHHSCLWTAHQNKQHFRVELCLCMSQHQKHKEGWKK